MPTPGLCTRRSTACFSSGEGTYAIDMNVETLVGPLYQQDLDCPLREPIRRFLAVVSNYYRSFLSEAQAERCSGCRWPRTACRPWPRSGRLGDMGPFTLPFRLRLADVRRRGGGQPPAADGGPPSDLAHPGPRDRRARRPARRSEALARPRPGRPFDLLRRAAHPWPRARRRPTPGAPLGSYWLDGGRLRRVCVLLNAPGPSFAYNLATPSWWD